MSTPAQQASFLDQANPLLAGVPARLDAGTVALPMGTGTAGVLTIRTASTTLSIFLTASDLDNWAKAIGDLAVTVRNTPVLARPTGAEISALTKGNGRPG